MAIVTPGIVWASGETVTPTKLNQAASPAVALADNEVTSAKILDGAVTAAKMNAASVTNSALAESAISGQSIVDSLATADSFLIFDASANALRRVTFADILAQTSPVGSVIRALHTEDDTRKTLTWTSNFGDMNTDTLPVVTAGAEVISLAITPSSSANKVFVNIQVPAIAASTTMDALACVFRESTAISLHRIVIGNSLDDVDGRINVSLVDSPATTSQVVYSLRIARDNSNSGSIFINGGSSLRRGGGAYKVAVTLQEIRG